MEDEEIEYFKSKISQLQEKIDHLKSSVLPENY